LHWRWSSIKRRIRLTPQETQIRDIFPFFLRMVHPEKMIHLSSTIFQELQPQLYAWFCGNFTLTRHGKPEDHLNQAIFLGRFPYA
jgi:hypothetical protein